MDFEITQLVYTLVGSPERKAPATGRAVLRTGQSAVNRLSALSVLLLVVALAVASTPARAQITCSLVRNYIFPDTCSGLCLPGSTCTATATRPYAMGLGTQAAACGCVPGGGLAPTPVPAPPTTIVDTLIQVLIAVAVIVAVLVALAVAIALALWLLAVALRRLLKKLLCLPDLRSFVAARDSVIVYKYSKPGVAPHCRLSFGRPFPGAGAGRPGIRFRATVVVPRGCRGSLEFVQDVVTIRTREPGQIPGQNNPKECYDSGGRRVLDTTDPYHARRVGPGVQTIDTNDSPSEPLRRREIATTDDQFRMFLMWRPAKWGGFIRVPLAKIEWYWQGRAEVTASGTGTCSEGANDWYLVSPPTTHGHMPAQWTLLWPTTSPNVTGLRWKKC